jgi:hypothetical protein
MPRRPKSLETVLLALEILRRIPRARKITAGDLHQQLKETQPPVRPPQHVLTPDY